MWIYGGSFCLLVLICHIVLQYIMQQKIEKQNVEQLDSSIPKSSKIDRIFNSELLNKILNWV